MRLKAHNALRNPVDQEVTSVVLYDDIGNPIFVAVSVADRTVLLATVNDPDFNQIMQNYGLSNRPVVVTDPQLKSLSSIQP